MEGLEFFYNWNVLELRNGLKECLEFLFLLWSLLFLTEASESSRATLVPGDECPAGFWGEKLAMHYGLGTWGSLCFSSIGVRTVVNL